MEYRNDLTHARLTELLSYDPISGIFHWLKNSRRTDLIGREAGTVRKKTGYRIIKIDGCEYLAHRLAWFYAYGEWPHYDLDHINCDKTDNSIRNLRQANTSQNGANRGMDRDNACGFKGVIRAPSGRYFAQIRHNHVSYFLGSFRTPEEANAAYMKAAQGFHGEFARSA